MKFMVSRTSDPLNRKPAEQEICSLVELLDLAVTCKKPVILLPPEPEFPDRVEWRLEIYDDWRE